MQSIARIFGYGVPKDAERRIDFAFDADKVKKADPGNPDAAIRRDNIAAFALGSAIARKKSMLRSGKKFFCQMMTAFMQDEGLMRRFESSYLWQVKRAHGDAGLRRAKKNPIRGSDFAGGNEKYGATHDCKRCEGERYRGKTSREASDALDKRMRSEPEHWYSRLNWRNRFLGYAKGYSIFYWDVTR